MEKGLEIQGLKELRQKLRELEGVGADKLLKSISRQAIDPYVQQAKDNAPVDDGDLRRSIGKEADKGKFRERGAIVAGPRRKKGSRYGQGHHAHLVEFGTAPRFTKNGKYTGTMGGRRFLTRAWDSTKREVLKIYKDLLREEIKKRAK